MKLVLALALAIALLFTAGESLECNHCVPRRPGEACEPTVEQCPPRKDGCASVKFLREPFGQFQKCMALSSCEMLKMNAYIDITCCSHDLCNTI